MSVALESIDYLSDWHRRPEVQAFLGPDCILLNILFFLPFILFYSDNNLYMLMQPTIYCPQLDGAGCMSICDKIRKIRKCDIFKINSEKTGVVNSLVMLGSIGSVLAAVEHEVHADVSCNSDGEITDTNVASDIIIDKSQWRNHCWNWSWCWCWSWGWGWGAS